MTKKNIFIILFLAFLSFIFAGIIFVSLLFKPVSQIQESQRFIIPKGQAISIIGERLHEQGLIKSPLAFRLIVKQKGLANKIQAGSFDLSPSMSLSEISIALTKGTEDLWVTIPEGYRVEEIAETLDSYEDLEFFDKKEFLELAKYSEGYLFPDTYLVPRQMDAQGLFDLLSDTFDKKVNLDLEDELKASDKTLEEILVMASIVEREAAGADDQPIVAGILWNRIGINMALQADATLQYSKGYNKIQDSWWVPPLAADKKINSPFNTYMNPGLPPRPICNPGISAIKATLEPKESDYFYYIHDRQGKIHYAKDIDGHNANVNKYLR